MKKKCPFCQKVVQDKFNFCPFCNRSLKENFSNSTVKGQGDVNPGATAIARGQVPYPVGSPIVEAQIKQHTISGPEGGPVEQAYDSESTEALKRKIAERANRNMRNVQIVGDNNHTLVHDEHSLTDHGSPERASGMQIAIQSVGDGNVYDVSTKIINNYNGNTDKPYLLGQMVGDNNGFLSFWVVNKSNQELLLGKFIPVTAMYHAQVRRFCDSAVINVKEMVNYHGLVSPSEIEGLVQQVGNDGLVLLRQEVPCNFKSVETIFVQPCGAVDALTRVLLLTDKLAMRNHQHGGISPFNVFMSPTSYSQLFITDYRLAELKHLVADSHADFRECLRRRTNLTVFSYAYSGGGTAAPDDVIKLGWFLLRLLLGQTRFYEFCNSTMIPFEAKEPELLALEPKLTAFKIADAARKGEIKGLTELSKRINSVSEDKEDTDFGFGNLLGDINTNDDDYRL